MPGVGSIADWRQKARELKGHVRALYLASRHPRTPWYAKAMAMLVVGYALSPIDLIPDPIPVLGYLDDMILLPLGLWLTLRLIPDDVWVECVEKAKETADQPSPRSWVAAAVVVVLWVAAVILTGGFLWEWMARRNAQ